MSVTAVICSDAKARLLDRAEDLFAEHGYELTSTRHIAGAAGMNLSLIRYYFGSKLALYREIFVSRLEEMSLGLQSINLHTVSATDKLTQFIMIFIGRYRSNGKFQRMLYREIMFLNKSLIKDVINNYLAEDIILFQEIMSEGVTSGDFKKLNTSFFYMTLISMMSMIICDAPIAGKTPGQVFTEDEIKTYLYQILLTKNITATSMN